ncbi:MAG: glycosyltransferase [Candidatus Woesearchaeota archaeon]
MAKKKIFFLGLNGRGGTLHYASSVSSHMTAYAETHLLLPSYSDTKLIDKKVKLLRITAPPNALKTVVLTFNIFAHVRTIRAINAIDPDVIDILDIHPWYMLWWPFLKAKKIVTINDPELHSGETGVVEGFILRRITKFLLKHAQEIIVLGAKQKETVRRLGYKQPVIVSRIGHYGFFAKNAGHVQMEPRTILFFGRIKGYKGLGYLLDALIGMPRNFKLVIAGDGDLKPYEDQLKKLNRLVEIHQEYIPDEKVAEYFNRSAFIVMPYTDATQTGVVQIAYSFSKPVIATNVGSLPEVVINGKTGIVVEPRDVVQLRKAITRLLDNPSLTKTYGANGHQFMKKELDWKKIVKKLYSNIFH